MSKFKDTEDTARDLAKLDVQFFESVAEEKLTKQELTDIFKTRYSYYCEVLQDENEQETNNEEE